MVELSEVCLKQCKRNCCEAIPYGYLSKADLDRFHKHGWEPKVFKLTETLYTDLELQDCPFFINNRCTIYPDRPFACRTYPIDFTVIISEGKVFLDPFIYPDKDCPITKLISLDDKELILKDVKICVQGLKEQGNEDLEYYLLSKNEVIRIS